MKVAGELGLSIYAFGDLARKPENILGCYGGKIPVFAEVITEFGEFGTIGSDSMRRLSGPGKILPQIRQ
ncbi:MAG: hypothetical protein AB2L11_00455 [Syntrophobacteraceae bacterium]